MGVAAHRGQRDHLVAPHSLTRTPQGLRVLLYCVQHDVAVRPERFGGILESVTPFPHRDADGLLVCPEGLGRKLEGHTVLLYCGAHDLLVRPERYDQKLKPQTILLHRDERQDLVHCGLGKLVPDARHICRRVASATSLRIFIFFHDVEVER